MVSSVAVKSNLANPSYHYFPCSHLMWHMFESQGSLSLFLKGYFLIVNSCLLLENVQSLWIQILLPLTLLDCQSMTTFPSLTFIDEFSIWTPAFLSTLFLLLFLVISSPIWTNAFKACSSPVIFPPSYFCGHFLDPAVSDIVIASKISTIIISCSAHYLLYFQPALVFTVWHFLDFLETSICFLHHFFSLLNILTFSP